ncbi:MAG: MoxR family ATPase [Gemella sp.]|nr:MoxR family ATPase [Gemella sp.]
MNIQELNDKLKSVGYISSKRINFAVMSAIQHNRPLILEGAPGSGKTSLAKAISQAFDLPLKRVQFYEGLTVDKLIYDYNYQKQLLSIEAIKASLENTLKDKNPEEALKEVSKINFYGEDFLIARPLLESIQSEKRTVLLLDEVDKSSEEIEYALLEFLEDYEISIPELGTVSAVNPPIVIITSNNYRELSEPLKRRCSYLYINDKTAEENEEIILQKTNVNPEVARFVATALDKFKDAYLKQQPSIAEAITWAEALVNNMVEDTLHLVAKNKKDRQTIERLLVDMPLNK